MKTIKDRLVNLVFYLSILFFIIGFNVNDTPVSGWYQQFMPNLGGRQISDVFFLDSLTGWAVTPYLAVNDTSYVLKTTNRGDDWFIQQTRIGQFVGSNRVIFLNANTGYTAGVSNMPSYSAILKTINGGNNWTNINPPTDPFTAKDISILNESTIWTVSDNSLTGGVYRTINGGASWDRQATFGSSNPSHIYMYNARIGFIDAGGLRKTTDGGASWTLPIPGAGNFLDMHFADSLTGWKCNLDMKKTTDGGFNWVTQTLPNGGNIGTTQIERFDNIIKDTIWGVGGIMITNLGLRGMVYRTTNGGTDWLFQVPDTTLINISQYSYTDFINKLNGWAYPTLSRGIHTTTGGDPIFYTGAKQMSSTVPNGFKLEQNFPNPFNPATNIKYHIASNVKREKSNVKLVVYNVLGKEITVLAEGELSAGIYETDFNGSKYSSGIYFYSLFIDGKLIDTKKMILIK